MSDKAVREELANLTEAVRDLREDEVTAELRRLRAEVEQLRAERGTHHCTGCSCMHIHWYPTYQVPMCAPGAAGGVAPLVYTTTGGVNISTTTAAAAPQPVYGYTMQMGSATEPPTVLSSGYSGSVNN